MAIWFFILLLFVFTLMAGVVGLVLLLASPHSRASFGQFLAKALPVAGGLLLLVGVLTVMTWTVRSVETRTVDVASIDRSDSTHQMTVVSNQTEQVGHAEEAAGRGIAVQSGLDEHSPGITKDVLNDAGPAYSESKSVVTESPASSHASGHSGTVTSVERRPVITYSTDYSRLLLVLGAIGLPFVLYGLYAALQKPGLFVLVSLTVVVAGFGVIRFVHLKEQELLMRRDAQAEMEQMALDQREAMLADMGLAASSSEATVLNFRGDEAASTVDSGSETKEPSTKYREQLRGDMIGRQVADPPAWLTLPEENSPSLTRFHLESKRYATVEEANHELLRRLTPRLSEPLFGRSAFPEGVSVDVSELISAGIIPRRLLTQTELQVGDETFPMYQMTWEVVLQPGWEQSLSGYWRPLVQHQRLIELGAVFGFLVMLIFVWAGYFRTDALTEGRYRARLKLAAIGLSVLVPASLMVVG